MSFGRNSTGNDTRNRASSFTLPRLPSLRNSSQPQPEQQPSPSSSQRRSLFNIVLTRVQGGNSHRIQNNSSEITSNNSPNHPIILQNLPVSSIPSPSTTATYTTPIKHQNRQSFDSYMHTVGTPDSDDVSLRGSPLHSRSNIVLKSPSNPTILFEQQQQNQSNHEQYHRHDREDHGSLSFNMPSAAKVPSPSMLALSMSTSSIGSSWSNELACLRQTGDDRGYSHLLSVLLLVTILFCLLLYLLLSLY